ncbi:MAG: hypothetical protein ACREN2_08720 [Candidatus Dormibacteria bacterium]
MDPGSTPSGNGPPYPAPGCPPGFGYLKPSPNRMFYTIYPTFTRNASGGYDGHDAWFGYDVPNAVSPGGDATRTDIGAPATAANIAGHTISVALEIAPASAWSSQALEWSKQQFGLVGPNAPGSCENGALLYGFGQAVIEGDAPAPPPSAGVLNDPAFGFGATLLANVMGRWRIGTIGTLPGPSSSTRTFVHIPTCAWLDSGVPTAQTALHSVTTTIAGGYTLFLVYTVTVTPQTVTWDWGDGAQSPSVDAPESPPPVSPSYDASTQTWSNPCSVSHAYSTVSAGRTISAQQPFTVDIAVSWNDGVTTHTQPVACDRATNRACALTVGPAQGWVSGPHPVDQIEPVPFTLASGG